MATYTVQRFSIAEPNGVISRHATLSEAQSSFDNAVAWYQRNPAYAVAWCNLISKDTRLHLRYLRHWERKDGGIGSHGVL